jgi:hypothetical protein
MALPFASGTERTCRRVCHHNVARILRPRTRRQINLDGDDAKYNGLHVGGYTDKPDAKATPISKSLRRLPV